MNGSPDGGGVLAWILGIISVTGALYATGRRIFNTVTRSELKEIIESQDEKFLEALDRHREDFERAQREGRDEVLRLHGENRDTASDTFDRLSEVEQGVARIEGQLSQHFPQRQDRR
jgi:hypothetical protein